MCGRTAPVCPGQHGQRRTKLTDYGSQLREKQKMKRIYGVLESPFKNYFLRAAQQKGVTGETCCCFWSGGLTIWYIDSGLPRRGMKRGSSFAMDIF